MTGQPAIPPDQCCILNGGAGSWAFDSLARQLSTAIGIPISDRPLRFNYLLHLENPDIPHPLFIPLTSIRIAADKRRIAATFAEYGVPTPRTCLLETFAEVTAYVAAHPESEWCLKFPTSCGANGHRLVTSASPEPHKWPKPFVLQQFIRQANPEVYRTYGAGGQLFGWVVRRFPTGVTPSPWVAHARGARYAQPGEIPAAAANVARQALASTGLLDSFGCVDLLRGPDGEWLALEAGTDGVYNHVDRELDCPDLEAEILRRIAQAFWLQAGRL